MNAYTPAARLSQELAQENCIRSAEGRVVLRQAGPSDGGLFTHYMCDPRVAGAMRAPPCPRPLGAGEALLPRSLQSPNGQEAWVIDGSGAGLPSLLGVIALKPMEESRFDVGQIEVSFWVAPHWWNRGVASEALRALIAANPHQARALFAEAFQSNSAAARVLANAGFRYLSDGESHIPSRAGGVASWNYLRTL